MKRRRTLNLRNFPRWAQHTFYRLLDGDRGWAEQRYTLVWIAVLAFIFMGRAVEQVNEWWTLKETISTWHPVVQFALSFVHPQTWRHLLLPLAGLLLAMGFAANYVRDLFELPDLDEANWYLWAAMFGHNYPTINVRSNGYELDDHTLRTFGKDFQLEVHPIVKIGGPGIVNVAAGNVALFERFGRPWRVAGAGWHFIQRFESLREVIDLRDQIRAVEPLKALTKDGIPVVVEGIEVAFRVKTGGRERTQKLLYPFSMLAVLDIAYDRTVSPLGPSAWTQIVPGRVAGAIRDHINRNRFDDLVAHSEADKSQKDESGGEAVRAPLPDNRPAVKIPREVIKSKVSLKGTGADLLWVSLGHLTADALSERIRAWEARWKRETKVADSLTDAHKIRLMEYAKVLARVEMIEKMIHSIEFADPSQAERVVIQWLETLNVVGQKTGSRPDAAQLLAKIVKDELSREERNARKELSPSKQTVENAPPKLPA
ncbi:MAG TPA: SPFH domain-containing protein [Anaerolineales bacterium]|nr:SPFH domain-containing protein [Anaerolineales bacterium]